MSSHGIQNIADCLKAGLSHTAPVADITKFLGECAQAAAEMKIEYWIDSGHNDMQAAMIIRSHVLQRIADINETSAIAMSRGYLLPDSPFPKIEQINRTRGLFQPIPLEYNDQIYLFNAARDLSLIADGYSDGRIKFARAPAVQLASFEVSVDGISTQSGDALIDILGYQPDGDFVKRKRAIDSLSKLDFSKRKPYLLFTLESDKGVIVCWSKMRDASGYVISRRDVFNGFSLPDIVESNAGLLKSTNELLESDRFYQAVAFYDWTAPQDVMAITDASTERDTLYAYRISGLQKKAPATPFIFDVPSNSLLFSPALAASIRNEIARETEAFQKDFSSASPYAAISKVIYGDSNYGWIIAGCNILASIRRGDSVDVIRANSYVGSTMDRIFSEAAAGRLFIPSDLTQVQAAVESAVSAYGVSQTILSVLDGVGMTNFISGKDDPNGIQSTQASIEGSTSGLARILSVIDPETATLDPKLIVIAGRPRVNKTGATEIRTSVGPSAFDEIFDAGVIDLTTYSGIGRLMQLLRVVYDFYPGAFV